MRPFLRMFIPKLTSLPPSTGLPPLNGALSLRSPLKDLLPQLLGLLAGTALWLRSEIRACHPSRSTLTTSVKAFAHQHSTLRSVL